MIIADIVLDGELYDFDPIEETCEVSTSDDNFLSVSDAYLEQQMCEAIADAEIHALKAA